MVKKEDDPYMFTLELVSKKSIYKNLNRVIIGKPYHPGKKKINNCPLFKFTYNIPFVNNYAEITKYQILIPFLMYEIRKEENLKDFRITDHNVKKTYTYSPNKMFEPSELGYKDEKVSYIPKLTKNMLIMRKDGLSYFIENPKKYRYYLGDC